MKQLLLGLIALFSSVPLWSQVNFKFAITNGTTTYTTTTSWNYAGPTAANSGMQPGTSGWILDLTPYGICEGDVIYIRSLSTGSISGDNINVNTQLWDAGWGEIYGPPYGWDIDFPLEFDNQPFKDLWNFDIHRPLTVPFSGGSGTVYHSLFVAPVLYHGFNNVYDSNQGCGRILRIAIKVNAAPEPFEVDPICPGTTVTLPSGVAPYNWSPFDPTVTPVNSDMTFTYDIGSGSCVSNYSLNVDVIESPMTFPTTLCADDLPYNISFHPDTCIVTVNGTVVYNATTGMYTSYIINTPGTYNIDYQYSPDNGTTVCNSTQTITVAPEINVSVPAIVEACGGSFPVVCATGGSPGYTYKWSYPFSGLVVSMTECFTPFAYGYTSWR